MVKRSAIFALLAVIVLSAAAWSAGEELTYSGPFVSVNSPFKLCATATDDMGPVAGVGLWFQAWDMAGSRRTSGPMCTVFTNSLGKTCNLFNVLAGLYEVQACGTGDFDGISSMPVVVSNYRSSQFTGVTSAGIAKFGGTPMTPPREAPFGLLLGGIHPQLVSAFQTGNGTRLQVVGNGLGGALNQFLWLDPSNPNGPTRVEARHFQSSSILQVISVDNKYGFSISGVRGWCYVQIGDDDPIQGYMTFSVDTGASKPLVMPYNLVTQQVVGLNDGMFDLHIIRPNGQVIYDVSGSFRGTTCTDF